MTPIIRDYDLLVVLGNGLDTNWQLPSHVKDRLQIAVRLYQDDIAPRIALCGKWSINWDKQRIIPPTTEAEEMRKFLEERYNIPSVSLITETDSKDTIGNAYYLKTQIVIPNRWQKLVVMCADFHEERAQFIFGKVFGKDYNVNFLSTPTDLGKDPEVHHSQQEVSARQQRFLAPMKDGDHTFLTSKLYTDAFYTQREMDTAAVVALGRRV